MELVEGATLAGCLRQAEGFSGGPLPVAEIVDLGLQPSVQMRDLRPRHRASPAPGVGGPGPAGRLGGIVHR